MEFESSITKITLRYQNNFIQVFTSYRITYRIINRITYCIINRIIYCITYCIINRITYCITQSYHLLYHQPYHLLYHLLYHQPYHLLYHLLYHQPYHLLYHATVSRTVSLTVSHNRITYCIINRIIYCITLSYHLLYHATVSLTVHLPLVLILISNSPRILISRQTVGIEIDNSIAICFAEVTFPCCII